MNVRADIDIEKAAKMWSEGVQQSHIAARFGVSLARIKNLVKQDRKAFPIRERATVNSVRVWTREDIAEASRMWNEGNSASVIGLRFGMGRVAILGLAFRHREIFPMRNKSGHAAVRPKASSAPAVRYAGARVPIDFEVHAQIPATEYDLQRLPHAKTLIDLEPCECKWALTSVGPHMFCAEVTENRSSYCLNHLERSLPRPEQRRLKAA